MRDTEAYFLLASCRLLRLKVWAVSGVWVSSFPQRQLLCVLLEQEDLFFTNLPKVKTTVTTASHTSRTSSLWRFISNDREWPGPWPLFQVAYCAASRQWRHSPSCLLPGWGIEVSLHYTRVQPSCPAARPSLNPFLPQRQLQSTIDANVENRFSRKPKRLAKARRRHEGGTPACWRSFMQPATASMPPCVTVSATDHEFQLIL